MHYQPFEPEKMEKDLKRDCLSIRVSHHEHTVISDTAWRLRKPVSCLIRELTLQGIEAMAMAEKEVSME